MTVCVHLYTGTHTCVFVCERERHTETDIKEKKRVFRNVHVNESNHACDAQPIIT